MSFRPWQEVPFSLGNLQDEMNRLFDRVWHGGVSVRPFDGQAWAPPIDVFDREDGYELYVETPGVEARAIDVSFVGNALTVRGEKVQPDYGADESCRVQRERRYGTFSRTVDLPGDADLERMSAKCNAGVLHITVPKSESSKPKAVKIEVDDE